jgi:hypothetical protein
LPKGGDPILAWLDTYSPERRQRLTVRRPTTLEPAVWLHPGEPLFEQWRQQVRQTLGPEALRGARLADPRVAEPYVLHIAALTVRRNADPAGWAELARPETLECRLVAVKESANGQYATVPVETLLLLQPAAGMPTSAQGLALQASQGLALTEQWLSEQEGQRLAEQWRTQRRAQLAESARWVQQGFAFQEAELALIRSELKKKADAGNPSAERELANVKQQQKALAGRRERVLTVLQREPDLIGVGPVEFIAHALVTPAQDAAAERQFIADVEQRAMNYVQAFEEAEGARVEWVHTPPLAKAAGLADYPGFDALSHRPDGTRRHIEVKGRAGRNAVEMTANEYGRAGILGDAYWLYAVFDCETAHPQLYRVQNPFTALLAHLHTGVAFSAAAIHAVATTENA